ncbi:MAG: hypothetical protein V4719_29750 [Planctomycetota bacterium]
MDVDEAFELFRSIAAARGGELQESTLLEVGDREYVLLISEKPCLRLFWQTSDQTITLDISHGPADGPEWWWLDLIKAKRVDRRLCFDTDDFSFMDAIDYGLELCGL